MRWCSQETGPRLGLGKQLRELLLLVRATCHTKHAHQGTIRQLHIPVRILKPSALCCVAGYDLVEIASFNAAGLDAAMTKRVFQEHGLQAACSLGLTLNADISSDSEEVCV
jgi:hypothetical protein